MTRLKRVKGALLLPVLASLRGALPVAQARRRMAADRTRVMGATASGSGDTVVSSRRGRR